MTDASRTPAPDAAASTPLDLARQIAVISALGFTLVAVLVGVGGLGGTEVEDSQGGQLSAQGSYLAPAGPAFSIWSVIYLGLIGYVSVAGPPEPSARRCVSGRWAGGSHSPSS